MNIYSRLLSAIAVIAILAQLCGCLAKTETPTASSVPTVSSSESEAPPSLPESSQSAADGLTNSVFGEVAITFDYVKQSGHASNQFAVWIEDANGILIKTLYATRFTANGGYKNRPDSIALWVEKSSPASISKDDIDAVTGATPKEGALTFTWDLTDKEGNAVPAGQYNFFVEGSLRWKNRVLYSGKLELGSVPAMVRADVEFFFEGNDNQPALSSDSPEAAMLGEVKANFTPGDSN